MPEGNPLPSTPWPFLWSCILVNYNFISAPLHPLNSFHFLGPFSLSIFLAGKVRKYFRPTLWYREYTTSMYPSPNVRNFTLQIQLKPNTSLCLQKDMPKSRSLVPYLYLKVPVTLFGNRIFAVVITSASNLMESPWILGWALNGPAGRYPYNRNSEIWDTQTQGRRSREDWSYSATSQEVPEATTNWGWQGGILPQSPCFQTSDLWHWWENKFYAV